MDTLTNHVTIRNYRNEPLSEELIMQLLHAGIRASTTGNMQWYSIIITTETSIKRELEVLHFNQAAAVTAPVILTFCADINRFGKWCTLNKAIPGYDNFMSFLNASIDALLVAQNFCIAAENSGLGICYLGTVTYNASEIIQLLKLPELVMPVASVAVGWPDISPLPADRLPLKAVVHHDVYKNYGDDEIMEYYHLKEQLESSVQYVRENKKETLAQVFTDIRYKKEDNEKYSDRFISTLRDQGFNV